MRWRVLAAAFLVMAFGSTAVLGVPPGAGPEVALARPGLDGGPPAPALSTSVAWPTVDGPAGVNVPFVVDESGDAMTGDLSFSGALGVQFPGGKLRADPTLMFGANGVCVANQPAAGCGDITAVNAGFWLLGGGASGDVTLAANVSQLQKRVSGVCVAGFSIREIGLDGAVTCEADDDTRYLAGAGLVLAGTLFSVAPGGITSAMVADGTLVGADVDATSIQRRVGAACPEGSAIRAVATDGSVGCEPDDSATYTGTSPIHVAGTTISLGTAGCTAGELWKWTGTAWSCDADTNSGGTVTSVGAGAGLIGGPITTSGTLRVATGGIVATMIADDAVQSQHVADGAIVSAAVAAGAVTSAHIADGTVQLVDLGFTAGDITAVSAGDGLSGGAASGDATLSLASCLQDRVLERAATDWACRQVSSSNLGGTIVRRDASGNFAAGSITAALSGNAATATALAANGGNCPRGGFITSSGKS